MIYRIIIYIICFLVGVIFFILLHNINTLDIVFPVESSMGCTESPPRPNKFVLNNKYMIKQDGLDYNDIGVHNTVYSLYDGTEGCTIGDQGGVMSRVYTCGILEQSDMDIREGFGSVNCYKQLTRSFVTISPPSSVRIVDTQYTLNLYNPLFTYEFQVGGLLKKANHATNESEEWTGEPSRNPVDYSYPRIEYLLKPDYTTRLPYCRIWLSMVFNIFYPNGAPIDKEILRRDLEFAASDRDTIKDWPPSLMPRVIEVSDSEVPGGLLNVPQLETILGDIQGLCGSSGSGCLERIRLQHNDAYTELYSMLDPDVQQAIRIVLLLHFKKAPTHGNNRERIKVYNTYNLYPIMYYMAEYVKEKKIL